MTQETKDYAFLHFIVLIWGFTAILGMLIELPSVEVVFFRVLLASLGLFVLLMVSRKSFRFRAGKDYFLALFTGGLIAAHWIFFFLSARVSNISVCLAGMATCSLWTSIVEPIFNKGKIRGFEVVLSFLAIMGIVIIFNVEVDHYAGLLIAIASAFLGAVFTVINGTFTKREDPFVITFYEMVGATIGVALFFPLYTGTGLVDSLSLNPSLADWFYLLVLALVCTVYAYSYSVKLMQRLSAFSVNLTVNLEPVYGIILALIFFPEREKMTPGFYLGTSLILLSVLLYPVLNRRLKKRALETDILR